MDSKGVISDVGIGALVTVVCSFLPFSSVLGGTVTGFRAGDGYLSGFGVGLAAGVVAMVPLLVLFLPALVIAGWLGIGVPPSSEGYRLFLTLVVLLFVAYTAGLSAVGGVAGVWIRDNTTWNVDPAEWT